MSFEYLAVAQCDIRFSVSGIPGPVTPFREAWAERRNGSAHVAAAAKRGSRGVVSLVRERHPRVLERVTADKIAQRNLTTRDWEGSFSSLMKAAARTSSNIPGESSRVVVVVAVIDALELLIGSGAVAA
jgi:hypothetical protein